MSDAEKFLGRLSQPDRGNPKLLGLSNIEKPNRLNLDPKRAEKMQAAAIRELLPEMAKLYTDPELVLAWAAFCQAKRSEIFILYVDAMFPGRKKNGDDGMGDKK